MRVGTVKQLNSSTPSVAFFAGSNATKLGGCHYQSVEWRALMPYAMPAWTDQEGQTAELFSSFFYFFRLKNIPRIQFE
jgi:hypothetical protein